MSSHTCKALVFRCIDFRLKLSLFSRLLESIGYHEGDYDLVSCAGGGKELATDEKEQAFLLKQIALSQKKHEISDVLFMFHDFCGAYGIPSPTVEDEAQTSDLKIISEKISRQFPTLKIRTFIIKGTTSGILQLKEIL